MKAAAAIICAHNEEEKFTVEWALHLDGISKDWSVTAWGEVGSVQVTVDNKTSTSFPLVKPDDSRLPADEGADGERTDGEVTDNEAVTTWMKVRNRMTTRGKLLILVPSCCTISTYMRAAKPSKRS